MLLRLLLAAIMVAAVIPASTADPVNELGLRGCVDYRPTIDYQVPDVYLDKAMLANSTISTTITKLRLDNKVVVKVLYFECTSVGRLIRIQKSSTTYGNHGFTIRVGVDLFQKYSGSTVEWATVHAICHIWSHVTRQTELYAENGIERCSTYVLGQEKLAIIYANEPDIFDSASTDIRQRLREARELIQSWSRVSQPFIGSLAKLSSAYR